MEDIATTITNCMVKNDKTLPSRLRKQEEELQELECTRKNIGRILEKYEISTIKEILLSSSEYFDEYFPRLKSFNRSKRHALAREIEEHGKSCGRCRLKIQNDLDWQKEFDTALSNHGERLEEAFKK